MKAKRASRLAIWLSILCAMIAIAAIPALLAGIGHALSGLLVLAGQVWFRQTARVFRQAAPIVLCLSVLGELACLLLLARHKRKQSVRAGCG
jgi:hypothetical protein